MHVSSSIQVYIIDEASSLAVSSLAAATPSSLAATPPSTLPRPLTRHAKSQPTSAAHKAHTRNTQRTHASHQANSQPSSATHTTSATHATLPLPSSRASSLGSPGQWRAAGEGGTERQRQGEQERGARGHGEGGHGEEGRDVTVETALVLSSKYLANTRVRTHTSTSVRADGTVLVNMPQKEHTRNTQGTHTEHTRNTHTDNTVLVNKVRFRLFATAHEPSRDGRAAIFQMSSAWWLVSSSSYASILLLWT